MYNLHIIYQFVHFDFWIQKHKLNNRIFI
jgi:hypothetical protein